MSKQECEKVPNSWEVAKWSTRAPHVWPGHSPSKIRWLIISKRDELTRAGALVRPGRNLLVIGPQYLSWLQRQSSRVDDFTTTQAATAARMAKLAAQASATR